LHFCLLLLVLHGSSKGRARYAGSVSARVERDQPAWQTEYSTHEETRMAIKSIKLKMYFKRDQNHLYQQVWHTHKIFNEGVAYYLKHLLLLRQIPAVDIIDPKRDLLRLARTAQSSNGKSKIGKDEEVLSLLRKLYEEIIPASTGKKANAQQLSRGFLSPLVDSKSVAGLGIAKKRKEPKEDEATNNQVLFDTKMQLGLLPLFKSFSDHLGTWIKRSVCTTWDRDMFQQAIERLCSWESWNIRVQNERSKLQQQVELLAEAVTPTPGWMACLQQFEQTRKIELDLIALPSDQPYRILKSGIRGWKDLREQWQSLEVKSKAELSSIISEMQNELRGDFGDAAVFHWLAREENHFIWDCAEDRISIFVKLNEAIEKRDRAKEQAQLTLPDPIHHPIWARFDGPGGNLQWYAIKKDNEEFSLSLVTLANEAGAIIERVITVPLAWSLQFNKIQVREYKDVPQEIAKQIERQKNDTKIQWVQWGDPGTKHSFFGKLGGAKVQFERTALEKGKNYFDTYINISVNYIPAVSDQLSKCFTLVKPDETSPWTIVDFKPLPFQEVHWAVPAKNGIAGLRDGLRVMSVALKLKSLAVCSVFEVQGTPTNFSIPIFGTHWHAAHQRTFILRLPGEEEQEWVQKKRSEVTRERIDLKLKLKKLSRFLSLAAKEKKEDREELLSFFQGEDFVDEKLLLSTIGLHVDEKQVDWQARILGAHKDLEHDFGKEMESWRKKYRRKSVELRNVCGLSMWWIQELTETRKLINAWCAHARAPKEIVRARSLSGIRKDKKAREVDLDKRLLRHIGNLKNDRIKKGADQIVMAALGYAYSNKKSRWAARYAPCRVILFQDISDFRMDRALSRQNNARLMAWTHRALPRHVAHQGEVFGMYTGTVRATTLSAIHARRGNPGVRMMQVEDEHLDQVWFARGYLLEQAKRHLIQKKDRRVILSLPRAERRARLLQHLRNGQFIPWENGDIIVTRADGKAVKGNALFNAAQLLQRLFWERQFNITKLWCTGSKETGFAPVRIGKRMEATFGYGKLIAGTENEYTWECLTKKQYNVIVGSTEDGNAEEDTRVEPIINTEVTNTVKNGNSKQMFFRDPTGEFAPADRWYRSEEFWRKIEKELDEMLN
jgi:hypothetical protein